MTDPKKNVDLPQFLVEKLGISGDQAKVLIRDLDEEELREFAKLSRDKSAAVDEKVRAVLHSAHLRQQSARGGVTVEAPPPAEAATAERA